MVDPTPHINRRPIATNGVRLSVMDSMSGYKGLPIILAHGFPELSYSWRHQLPAIAHAGYRVLAPDQRGYGASDRPERVEDYDIVELTNDLLGILDDLGEERGIFVGHDWGSMVVWSLAQLAPERVAGVVGMSVPFIPRGPMPPMRMLRELLGDAFFYMLYFQEPEIADRELGGDTARTMRRFLAAGSLEEGVEIDPVDMFANDGRGFIDRMPEPDGLPAWLEQAELDHYITEFTRTGFTGGINWYRNFDRNWGLTESLADRGVDVPSMFIGGSLDPVLLMTPPSGMDGWMTHYHGTVLVPGAGHWVQQEKPDPVNEALINFFEMIRTTKPR